MAMADEPGAGAAYLAALKQSTAPQAAGTAPARVPNASPSGTAAEPVSGSIRAETTSLEKRTSPRYKCQGSARLQEIGSTVATWATVTDINLQGCYLEATANYRVGAPLSLRLEVNGFRVDATAEVRVAYPQLGIGISFSRMSDKDRERLQGLLRSISPPSVVVNSIGGTGFPSIPTSEPLPAVTNPGAALQAILKFFDNRHVMGREEFLRILQKSQ